MNKQKGFTLIELVMVIVILGILAAFAIPRFADITIDARKATVDAMGGSLRAAAALAHATSLAQSKSSTETITMEGVSVAMSGFYPTASTGGIATSLVDYTGFSLVASGTATLLFQKDGATTPSSCYALYTHVLTANTAPTISVNKTDC